MNTNRRRTAAVALAVSLALCAPFAAFAEEAPVGVLGTTYFATVVNPGGPLARSLSVPLKLRIDRLSTADEARQIAELFGEPGNQRVKADRLVRKNLGFVQLGDHIGLPIAAAFAFEQEGAQRIVLMVNRRIAPAEFVRSLRSTDYPFLMIEVDIDRAGHGSGEMLPAAQVSFRADGTLDFRNLQTMPSRIFALRAFDS